MSLRTKVFDMGADRHINLSELDRGIGISVSQVYRVRQGERPINEKFIIGAIKIFSGYTLDDLFYIPNKSRADRG